MKKTVEYCCIVVLLILLNSCIKEDLSGCPTGYVVKVSVKDKNYTNIGAFPQLGKVDESLPFRYFLGTVYYSVKNMETGQVVQESSVLQPSDAAAEYTITLKDIPSGNYEVTVWGNLTSDVAAGILHPQNKEHSDIYVSTAIFNFKPGSETGSMSLERAKGKLVVFCTNFPENVTQIQEKISPVYEVVDKNLTYGGNTQVEKNATVMPINELLVAPTPPGSTTKLNLSFYTNNRSIPILIVPETEVPIQRNEISAMMVDYNTVDGAWEIWVYVQGEWTMIHHLDIH